MWKKECFNRWKTCLSVWSLSLVCQSDLPLCLSDHSLSYVKNFEFFIQKMKKCVVSKIKVIFELKIKNFNFQIIKHWHQTPQDNNYFTPRNITWNWRMSDLVSVQITYHSYCLSRKLSKYPSLLYVLGCSIYFATI